MLNSFWSVQESCCVQPIYCSACKVQGTNSLLGVEVKAVLNNCTPSTIKQGQVSNCALPTIKQRQVLNSTPPAINEGRVANSTPAIKQGQLSNATPPTIKQG